MSREPRRYSDEPRLIVSIPLEGRARLWIHAGSDEDERRLRGWLRPALRSRGASLSDEIVRWLDELDVREAA